MIKLILLDFDGTLVDTRRANAQAYIQTLAEVGIPMQEQEYLDRWFGMRCREFLTAIGIDDPTQRETLRLRKIALYPHYFDSLRLNEGLWQLCQDFRRTGGRVWIVSTGSRANIENAMHHLGLEGGVDGILTGLEIEHPKPAPDCFLEVMHREGCTPQETLIFEDSAVGLAAAKASGAAYMRIQFDD